MRRASRVFAAALIAVLLLPLASARAADQCRPAESVTSFGTWFDPTMELNAQYPELPMLATNWVHDAHTVRLLLKVSSGLDRHWHLVVRDSEYRVLAVLYPRDFAAPDGSLSVGRWTGRLPTASVRIDLRAAEQTDVRITVAGALALPPSSRDERQFSTKRTTPDWHDLYADPNILARRAGDSVGMLIAAQFDPDTKQYTSWCCTGVMVGADMMLTNWHCGGTTGTAAKNYWDDETCANTVIDLGWDSGLVSRQYACAHVEARDQTLDFALLRVRPVVGAGGGIVQTPFIPMQAGIIPDDIFLVHHAMCTKKLYSGNCKVGAQSYPNWNDPALKTDLTYDCDTEPGASGAPVFGRSGQLIGLHHLGYACAPPDNLNKAVRVSEIIAFLDAHKPAIAAELRAVSP